MDSAALLFLGLLATLAVGGRVAGSRLQSPTTIRLHGTAPDNPDWVARAVRKSVPALSAVSWTHSVTEVTPEDGTPYFVGRISGDGDTYTVEVTAPRTTVGQHLPASDPLVAVVHLQNFRYNGHWFHRLVLGQYPDTVAVRARGRAIRQLRAQFAGGGLSGLGAVASPRRWAAVVVPVAVLAVVIAFVTHLGGSRPAGGAAGTDAPTDPPSLSNQGGAPQTAAPTADPSAPAPAPAASDPPATDGARAETVTTSPGAACRTTDDQSPYGAYSTAVCRIWQPTDGLLTGGSLAVGPADVTCQRDLDLDNPVYRKGQTNTWWVWTLSDQGSWDWFPETAVTEGVSDQPINGITLCADTDTDNPATGDPTPTAPATVPADGGTAVFENFSVTVTSVERTRDTVRVSAEVCVRRLPPDPQGNRTRISRDPWTLTTSNDTSAAKRSTAGEDAFPVEDLYREGQCARGWIPFPDKGTPRTIVYRNGLGDRATWDASDPAADPVIG